MHDPTPFDEFRAMLDGKLDAADAARLRARLAADAALRAEFDAYAEVHAVTADAGTSAPKSGVEFGRVDAARRAERGRRLRPWIAAAATLLVGTGAIAAYRAMSATPDGSTDVGIASRPPATPATPRPGSNATPPAESKAPRTVALHAISLADAAASIDGNPLPQAPALLDDYRPVESGRVRWVASVDDAYSMAKWTGRPVLLWIYMEACPLCQDLGRRGFVDRDVLCGADRFVPLRVDVTHLPKDLEPLVMKGGAIDFGRWPYLAVMTCDRKAVAEFPGGHDPVDLRARLDGAWTKFASAKRGASPLAWDVANDLSAKLAQGGEAWKQAHVGDAWRAFDEVARRGAGSVFADVAKSGVGRVADAAAVALRDAKHRAESDDPAEKRAGARSLSEAAERFRGTPYGTDLAEVEQELRATGRFPALAEIAK